MSTRKKILLGIAGVYIVAMGLIILIFGATRRDNDEFAPQNEFKTDTWIALPGPFDINKAVLYLVIAGVLTVITMVYIANRAIGAGVARLATGQEDVRRAVGLNLGALIARSWLVGLTILAVGLAGEREDGLTAAVLVLAAFTLYFVTSLLTRSLEGKASR